MCRRYVEMTVKKKENRFHEKITLGNEITRQSTHLFFTFFFAAEVEARKCLKVRAQNFFFIIIHVIIIFDVSFFFKMGSIISDAYNLHS